MLCSWDAQAVSCKVEKPQLKNISYGFIDLLICLGRTKAFVEVRTFRKICTWVVRFVPFGNPEKKRKYQKPTPPLCVH